VSAGTVWQRQQDDSRTRLYSVNLSYPLAMKWFANFNAQRQDTQTTFLLTLVHSLGPQGSVAMSAQASGSGGQYLGQASVQAQQAESLSGGLGWQVYSGVGQVKRQLAGLSWLGDAGRFVLEAAHDSSLNTDSSALRLGGRGGLLWLENTAQATRGLGDGSMALVVLPGLAGVPVYAQHRQVAVTDSAGRAWVSALLPHQDNVLGIDATDLPMDVRVDSDEIIVRPPARAAVRVTFPLRRTQAALLTVVDAGQRAIPVGARAQLAGATQAFPFGRNGVVYLEGLDVHNRLEVQWTGHRCVLEFDVPAGQDPQPEIGPLTCREAI
jgi:outer membrane usher protein